MVLDGRFRVFGDVCDRDDHGDEDDAVGVGWAVGGWLNSSAVLSDASGQVLLLYGHHDFLGGCSSLLSLCLTVLTVGAATVDQQVVLRRTAVLVAKCLQFIDK